ncbi:MAG: hypothetical protein JKY26_07920 [Pseudomonas sp.]|nr:hypothetical protein [Pseudomonas sp.]
MPRELAAALADYSIREEVLNDKVVVLALPRGGVPVAGEIADKLALPLDLPKQYDFIIHYDETSALQALDVTVKDPGGEADDTYPSGL